MRIRSLLPIVVLFAVACTERRDITEAGAGRALYTTGGTLDQNIGALLALFPNGLANAGTARWTNVKRKYQAGLTDASEMRVAKDMLFQLADWVQQKAPEMGTPPNDESKAAAAARLTLYMSLYVYGGPTTPPPTFTAGADDAVGLVTPTAPATIVTPTTRAGVALETGSVDESTIIVITENPTLYPTACSGPLATKVCQYPRFYTFNEFPHKRLLKAAKFAVCHVNAGDNRRPLADHMRFRLAHDKPADPADYTPSSTIRDQNGESVEILPYITQAFSVCTDVQYALAGPGTGLSGALGWLAHAMKTAVTPKSAYAIDQGGGGLSLDFSAFNDVDPLSQPDIVVQNTAVYGGVSDTAPHIGDHLTATFAVHNTGTAASGVLPVTLRLSTTSEVSLTGTVIGTGTMAALAPGASATVSVPFLVPDLPSMSYFVTLIVGEDPALPDLNLSDNAAFGFMNVTVGFVERPVSLNVGSASACWAGAPVFCWGLNQSQQLGIPGPDVATPFAPTSLPPIERLSSGMAQHVCGIQSDNSATCWGRNQFGELGGGTLGVFFNPPVTVLGGISWASITVNRLTTCGVSTGGVGYCWGSNQRGEVGNSSVPFGTSLPAAVTTSTQPVLVEGELTFKSIVAGWLHACGITTSGLAYCWGDNNRGQLGIGSPDSLAHRSPVPVVGGLHFIQLSLGATQTCGITVDHLAYCWGENFTGQLGDGTTTRRASPTRVAGGAHYGYIATGAGFTDGTTAPVPPGAPQGGVAHTCALTESGMAHCWGWNGAGQLGEGTTVDRLTPFPVAGGVEFTSLASGGSATCAQSFYPGVWCWGGNLNGQLGNGTFTSSSVPVQVNVPFFR